MKGNKCIYVTFDTMLFQESGPTIKMGFSSSLQGDSAHEALITRQDAELRLLENMKRLSIAEVNFESILCAGALH